MSTNDQNPVTPLVPTYVLRHDTPAGPRFLIPVVREAAYQQNRAPWNTSALTVTGVDADGSEVEVQDIPGQETRQGSGKYLPGYVLSAVLLVAYIVRWSTPGGRGPWRKRPELAEGTDPTVAGAWQSAPDEPSEATLDHLDTYEHGDGCLGCLIARGVYSRPELPPVPHEHRVELPPLTEIPGDVDPDPDREWIVDDPTLLHVYGRHTAHLWPGTTGGLRKAVVDALNAHPMCAPYVKRTSDRERYSILGGLPAYLSDYQQREEAIKLNVPIPWDVPQQTTRAPRGRERKRQPVTERIAMNYSRTIEQADRLRGANKAAALARFPEVVAEVVASLLPTDGGPVQACSHCAGKGFRLGQQ